ncbi:MAG: sialidase family protein [Desulfovibrio sp.]
MPSLDAAQDRHVVIDRRAGQYLCFPDVCLTDAGTLLCAYNEFDRHAGTRRRLLLRQSRDQGRTWGRAVSPLDAQSHCPRLSRLGDGTVMLIDDAAKTLLRSADSGRTWTRRQEAAFGHGLLDRVLDLGGGTLLSAGHVHLGTEPWPKIRQAPTEQVCYVSRDHGDSWAQLSTIARLDTLVLCEASVIRLPGSGPGGGARLLALMRENSFVGEPMYFSVSEDGGAHWSAPAPTPLVGHRPTLGWTRSGRLLVTYRDVGPDPGTKAWLGELDELCSDFRVHGLHPDPGSLALTPQGLRIQSEAGPLSPVRYLLRPLSDPERALADFEAEVLVTSAGEQGCGIRLGVWWRLFPDCIVPDADGAGAVAWEPGRPHSVRIVHEPGLCRLFVDGEACGEYPVDPLDGNSRPILFGAVSRKEDNACEALWRRVSLVIREPLPGGAPGQEREYAWRWDHAQGFPDAFIDSRVLELKNDRDAAPGDFGYSGWAELADGEFFCAHHHGGGYEPEYLEGYSAHVLGTRFFETDFGAKA